MYQVQGITSDSNQTLTFVLPDKSESIQINLRYFDNLQCWIYDLISSKLTVNNRKLVTGTNLLRQWKNILSFGLACFAVDGSDPLFINDFTSGRCSLMILDSDEVVNNETLLQYLRGTIDVG